MGGGEEGEAIKKKQQPACKHKNIIKQEKATRDYGRRLSS